MAVNESDGKPPNGDDFAMSDLERLGRASKRSSAQLQKLRYRRDEAKGAIRSASFIKANEARLAAYANEKDVNGDKRFENTDEASAYLDQFIDKKQRTVDKVGPQITLYKAAKRERLNEQAVNAVGRAYSESSVNGSVAKALNDPNIQMAATANMGKGWDAITARKEEISASMAKLRNENMEAARTYIGKKGVNEDTKKKFEADAKTMQKYQQEYAVLTGAQKQIKAEGGDPESQQRALLKSGQSAAQFTRNKQFQMDAANKTGLGAMSREDLDKKQADAARELTRALTELKKSAELSKKDIADLNQAAKNASKTFEEISEYKDANGDGGGSKYANEKIIAGAVAEALGLITSGFQNVAIQQPLQMVQNVQSAANMENEKYNMWHQALGGDMSARMNLGLWANADKFGQQQYDRVAIKHGLTEGKDLVETGLGTVQMGEAVAGGLGEFLGSSRVEAGAQGAKTAISGVVEGVQEGFDWERHLTQQQARYQSVHAVVNAGKAVNYVTGQQLQQYRNYAMGLNEAAGQMGGTTGEAFLNQTQGKDFLNQMETQRVGLQEMGQLSAQGASAMGSMFNANQSLQSVRLENLGFGTADQNMARMGKLGAAGTNDPNQNLQKIIEEGMQRGLNSSKAIDMIVENTARMTEETTKAGGLADPTEFLTKTILGAMDKNNPNKEMAAQVAYQTFQSEETARHNISTSFSGIINVDRNMKDLGMGTDRKSAALLTQIPTAMLNAYKGKSEAELKEFLEGRGVNVKQMDQSLFKGGKIIDILNKNSSISELAGSTGVGYAMGDPGKFADELLKNKGNKKVINALVYGKGLENLTDEQRALRQGIAGAYSIRGENPNAGIANAAASMGIVTAKDNQRNLAAMDAEAANTLRGAAQGEKRLKNKAEIGQAKEGAEGLDEGKGAIKGLAETGRVAFEKAGKDAEASWKDAASKTAENFGKSTQLLDKATGKLDQSADSLLKGTAAFQVVTESFGAYMKKMMDTLSEEADAIKKKISGD